MILTSRCAGWGRNFWSSICDGTVRIRSGDESLYVRVHCGYVVEQTRRKRDECTTLRYGEGLKTRKRDKTTKEEYYEPGTLQAIRKGSLWKRETGVKLCGSKGTLECYSTSSGAYGKEIFTYNNGVLGYIATRWRKKLEVRHPNGKLWMVVKGSRVRLGHFSILGSFPLDGDDYASRHIMRDGNWELTVYDAKGSEVVTQGRVQNQQKQGKWLEKGKTTYYMSGVKVSRKLYEENPETWDANEVLRIPNAQLRCSLLNRMGYDKLLEKVKHRIIDESGDGGQLIEIDTDVAERPGRWLDKIMRLIKVVCPSTSQVYVLRVPPDIGIYEQARQWTFGLREGSLREGAHLALVRET